MPRLLDAGDQLLGITEPVPEIRLYTGGSRALCPVVLVLPVRSLHCKNQRGEDNVRRGAWWPMGCGLGAMHAYTMNQYAETDVWPTNGMLTENTQTPHLYPF